jgi:lysozyme
MRLSAEGLNLIKQSEGFRGQTYMDAAGYPTIGYGHRLVHPECFPHGIDQAQAEALLRMDAQVAELAVARLVKVPLSQGQFDALVDFVFNLGAGRLAASTLLNLLNEGNFQAASEELLRWDHAGGREVEGLKDRRLAEFNLWKGFPSSVTHAA